MTDKQINTCEFLNICQTDCNGTLENTEMCHCYELYKQLKCKEQECEELKKKKEENTTFYLKKYANKDSECLELQHKINVLKQTLTEIKKIAEKRLL